MRTLFPKVLLILVLMLGPAWAQQSDDVFANVPEEYIKEAGDYHQACEKNTVLAMYHDCSCLSLRFLEKRIELGSEAPFSQIDMALVGECRDDVEAIGHEYNQCLNGYAAAPKDRDPIEFCECYARTYIDLVIRYKPALRSAKLVPLRTRASTTCRDPEFARKIYKNH